MSSSTPQFLSTLKQTTKSLTTGCRPWSVFLDLSSLNLPASISDTTTRIAQNLSHFYVNYAIILTALLSLSLLKNPLALIALFITFIGWFALYFSREEPLTVLGYEVSDWVVLVVLSVVTFSIVVLGGEFVHVLVGGGVGVALVGLHAALRSTDDLVVDDIEASPYGNLLSDDENDRPSGEFTL